MTALSPVDRQGDPPELGALAKVLESREPANFQNVAVCNSSDVHFGNKTYINGPVTIIKQSKDGEVEEQAAGTAELKTDPPLPQWAWKGVYLPHGVKWVHSKWGVSPSVTLIGAALVCGTILVCLLLGLLLPTGPNSAGGAYWTGKENQYKNVPINTEIDKVLLTPNHVRMILRPEWLAQPPAGPMDTLVTPVAMVIITHTATGNCSDQASCTFQVRTMQTYHIESRNWSDIGYNFLVGGDGSVYEGRGWDIVGAHTKGYNVRSIGIAIIGTFNDVLPPKRQLVAAKKLLELGVAEGKLTSDYKLFGHRQLIPVLSPGNVLFAEIQTWPHFSTIDE